MKNKNHPSETLPIDNDCQTGLPLFLGGVFYMKEIRLSQEKVALVDDEDFESLNQFKWHATKMGKTFYSVRNVHINGRRNTVQMHNVILNGKGIDHIDGNGLNNQKSNLRLCTQSENNMNRSKQENTSSIYKGVHFHKRTQKWLAQITINSKKIHLGYFVSEVEAAKAYNKKATDLFCEFANLNNIHS